jgi:hypothetical protein
MKWMHEAVSNSQGRVSSARVIALAAGLTLTLCTLVLTPLAYFKVELVTPLTAFGTVLGALAGAGYTTNKIMAGKTETKNDV